ncbi:MAG: hypothetical protein LBE91_07915 [Tannerella sp.]|nr:hypothetical protein [Tannerella sp.]
MRNRGKRYKKRGDYKSFRGIIRNRVSINERPEIVNEKVRLGDLEIDTVISKNHREALLTITDRVGLIEWIKKLTEKLGFLTPHEFFLNYLCNEKVAFVT